MSPMHESYPVPATDTATRRAAQMAEVRAEYDVTHADEPYEQPSGNDIREAAVSELATMAEEPVDNRLRRAWLNGFREGFERAAYIQRFDH